MNGNVKKREVYFDAMRILACALVIFNHLDGYWLYQGSTGVKQFFYMCLTMIARINVPIFFMISGALLLDRTEDIKTVLKKRFLRTLILIIIFETVVIVIYKCISVNNNTEFDVSFLACLERILKNQIGDVGAYWYLYSYLGFLLTLPLLQRMIKQINKEEFVLIMIIHFIAASAFPMINLLLLKSGSQVQLSFSKDFVVPFSLSSAFFFPLVGYYVEHKVNITKLTGKHLVLLLSLATVGILLSNGCTYMEASINGEFSHRFAYIFDYVTAIVVYLIIKYFFVVIYPGIKETGLGKGICTFGALTLGIYMLDPCFKLLFYMRFVRIMEPILPTLIVSFVWVILSMTFGSVVTVLLKKVPGIRKIL